jgi:hypothetical protein
MVTFSSHWDANPEMAPRDHGLCQLDSTSMNKKGKVIYDFASMPLKSNEVSAEPGHVIRPKT